MLLLNSIDFPLIFVHQLGTNKNFLNMEELQWLFMDRLWPTADSSSASFPYLAWAKPLTLIRQTTDLLRASYLLHSCTAQHWWKNRSGRLTTVQRKFHCSCCCMNTVITPAWHLDMVANLSLWRNLAKESEKISICSCVLMWPTLPTAALVESQKACLYSWNVKHIEPNQPNKLKIELDWAEVDLQSKQIISGEVSRPLANQVQGTFSSYILKRWLFVWEGRSSPLLLSVMLVDKLSLGISCWSHSWLHDCCTDKRDMRRDKTADLQSWSHRTCGMLSLASACCICVSYNKRKAPSVQKLSHGNICITAYLSSYWLSLEK